MENASKALIMAGGILISVIIISLLVVFFGNLRDAQNVNLSVEEVKKATEFNKQYDVYARDLYGSDILTIANKITDYNKRESDNKGYTKIELVVKINENIDDKYFVKNAEGYKIPDSKGENPLQEKVKQIETNLKEYSSTDTTKGNVYKNSSNIQIQRTIAQLAKMRTNEWKELLGIDNKIEEEEIQRKINEYNSLKNLESQFKSRTFKYKGFKYDKNTGRITEMQYEL